MSFGVYALAAGDNSLSRLDNGVALRMYCALILQAQETVEAQQRSFCMDTEDTEEADYEGGDILQTMREHFASSPLLLPCPPDPSVWSADIDCDHTITNPITVFDGEGKPLLTVAPPNADLIAGAWDGASSPVRHSVKYVP